MNLYVVPEPVASGSVNVTSALPPTSPSNNVLPACSVSVIASVATKVCIACLKDPDKVNPSFIVTCDESPEDIVFVSIVFALKVPETFNESLICIDVESFEPILFVSIVSTLKVPVISTASANVIFVESSELIVVPCTLTALTITSPVPEADITKSSFDLVPVI